MNARLRKWGNSLGLRIPKTFAGQLGIGDGDEVDLAVTRGRLEVRPRRGKTYVLKDLLRRITPRNRHPAVKDGGPAGRELL